ncbi:hypothetical protein PFISCL1PPCAC_20285, partial [Pristionchus fissidentatus]
LESLDFFLAQFQFHIDLFQLRFEIRSRRLQISLKLQNLLFTHFQLSLQLTHLLSLHFQLIFQHFFSGRRLFLLNVQFQRSPL